MEVLEIKIQSKLVWSWTNAPKRKQNQV